MFKEKDLERNDVSFILEQTEDTLDRLKRVLSSMPEEERALAARFVAAGFALGIGAAAALFAGALGGVEELGELYFYRVFEEVYCFCRSPVGPPFPGPGPGLPS